MNTDSYLSVVIVDDGSEELMRQCLRSVRAATESLDCEIGLVINSSADNLASELQEKTPAVHLVNADKEGGILSAVNRAIECCSGEYLLLLKSTTVVGEGMLRTLCYFMDEQLNAGALGVRMLDCQGRYLPESRRVFPSPWLSFCQLFGLTKVVTGGNITAGSYLPELNSDSASPTDVVSNGFLLLRKAVLEEMGLFDESFDYRWADIDLLYRINRAGYLNYYYPERVVSYRNERLNRKNYPFSKSFYDAMRQFLRKHHRRSALFVNGGIALRTGIQSLFSSSSKTKQAKD
ncbi:glycosyltransferase, partial [Parabacteroides sp. OttesenSCG-928-N08]|nr:glycosyltransferase [Parabacteroides sp. OttesenSCG-928-N08]